MSNFYNFQLSFLFAAPFKRYEQLSELVKMYPCLYNKQEKDFKKEEVKQRAWKEIAKELDLENGKVVEQLWNTFKKLLFKRRTKLKEVDVSGDATGPVNKARKEANFLFSRKKFDDNISLVGMSWRYKVMGRYKNIALKMSLSPGNK